jgi:hypothetical protein
MACCLASYAQDKQVLRGEVIGRKSGNVYLYASGSFRNGHQLIDSARLTSSFFSFTKPLDEPAAYFITVDGAVGQFYFVWDKSVVVTLKPDNLNESVTEDSPVNEQLKSFADTLETAYVQKKKANREAFALAEEAKDEVKLEQLGQAYYLLFMQEWYAIDRYIRANTSAWASLFVLVKYHKSLGRKATLDLLSGLSPAIQSSRLAGQLKSNLSDASYVIMP